MLPSNQEIKAAVFALNKDSAPGPDGFGAFFFHHYWEIVKTDVSNAVLQFFNTSWILPDVLSRSISKLVSDGVLDLIKGKLAGLNALKELFSTYAFQSGQVINTSKSTIFSSSITQGRVLRENKSINHHIYSSLWSSCKDEFATLMENSTWLLGNGENINFWKDNWCGTPLAEHFNIPHHVSLALKSKVSDYIHNGQWNIPIQLTQAFNNISNLIHQVTIPVEPSYDKILWIHSDSGDLQLKEAYLFKQQQVQDLHWAKTIWSIDIQPSKSLFSWRLMHNKVPTDENLMLRGCAIPSMNHEAEFLFCFAEPLVNFSPYHAELCGAMRAIEIAHQLDWKNLWLETDSTIVVSAFKNRSAPVAWNLRNKWHNTLVLLSSMNCIVTHIYREGNQVVDLLANHGLGLAYLSHWHVAPLFIKDSLRKNHLELYAIYQGLTLAKDLAIDELICYSDSLLCINLIKGPIVNYHVYVVLIQDIKEFISQSNVTLCHTFREGNQCADFLAKLGASSDADLIIHASPPDGIFDLLKSDSSGTFFLRD
ncbi:hypothetical protein TSUD_141980 [Trifolium subterraneum]|uniref:Uncharacterized protein n=1 Tax=Trifolium subterraneum TaxID=3900 RepID=A0A2Z6MD27_TRISU|nr:hypothetical protein TSUD_141980 [Trifolium subterraneum]